MTTIPRAYTGDQMTLDGPHLKATSGRRARCCCGNHDVPNSTGAALKQSAYVIPRIER